MRILVRTTLTPLLLLAVPALLPVAAAQEPPPPAAPSAARAPEPPSLDALESLRSELPSWIRVVDGVPTASSHARAFYESGPPPELFGAVRARATLSLAAEGGRPGTAFFLEFAEDVPPAVDPFLTGSLWGRALEPTAKAPDDFLRRGRFLALLSFPAGDRAGEWMKTRITERFGFEPSMGGRRAALRRRLAAPVAAEDSKEILRLLDADAAVAAGWAYGHYLRGEYAPRRDLAAQAKSYAAAIELHEEMGAGLRPIELWGCLDGLGFARLRLGELDAAESALLRAREVGASAGLIPRNASLTPYNLARVLGRKGEWARCLAALREAVERHPPRARDAVECDDLEGALLREEFLGLLRRRSATPPVAARVPFSLAALPLVDADLPPGVRLVAVADGAGPPVLGSGARALLAAAGKAGSLPAAKARSSVSLVAEGRKPGSVLAFEYAADVSRAQRTEIEALLYGTSGSHSWRTPEEVVTHGRYLLVLSFERGDPAAEWWKERIRRLHGVRAPANRPELGPLARAVTAALSARDAARGRRLLAAAGREIDDWSFGWYLRGELARIAGETSEVERAARRAVALDESLEDPLPEPVRWAALDTLGGALLGQRKFAEAADAYRRALTVGEETGGEPAELVVAEYNLACALALLGRVEEAATSLRGAIAKNPAYRDRAKKDPDFDDVRDRAEFRVVLGE